MSTHSSHCVIVVHVAFWLVGSIAITVYRSSHDNCVYILTTYFLNHIALYEYTYLKTSLAGVIGVDDVESSLNQIFDIRLLLSLVC